MEEVFSMSKKEVDRLKILSLTIERKITQAIAAKQMDVSERHLRRLLKSYKTHGISSVISKKKGQMKNHCLSKDLKTQVLQLIQEFYSDFGPKLANKYLYETHNISISTETLRSWMIEKHFWIPRSTKPNLHPPRARRSCFGELLQIDGSHHHWFEDRGDPCVLMVMVDDATSAITSLHFAEGETLEAYFTTLYKHLTSYGIPLSLYGDKCSVLTPRCKNEGDGTQFQKALKELNCKLILAHSPQAKGKVERANRTLQDRLVKELRLRKISTIKEGNNILEGFREEYNRNFSKRPNEQINAHRSIEGICLENVLSIREVRTLSKDYVVQFKNNFYYISRQEENVHLFKNAKVEIRELMNGDIKAFVLGKQVNISHLKEIESPELDEKQLLMWKSKKVYTPSKNHPYKRSYNEDIMRRAV